MRETKFVSQPVTVILCDICKKETSHSDYNVCSVCDREVCRKCWGTMVALTGIGIMPCPICYKVRNKYVFGIKKKYDEAEKKRAEGYKLVEEWGKASKEVKK